jgi:ubiquinone/menaquinone biosynthesis C-methylase UbiE
MTSTSHCRLTTTASRIFKQTDKQTAVNGEIFMMNRRKLLGVTAVGAAAMASSGLLGAAPASAASFSSPGAGRVALRGADGRLVRLGTLDVESRQDFTKGFRIMSREQMRARATAAMDRVLAREGIDPTQEIDMPTLMKLVEGEPEITLRAQTWLANQRVTWKNLQDYFYENADMYLSEMEAADSKGPGSLELSPRMTIPDHTAHQVHIQPGGYVGDPFAGHMYHYATNSFYIGVGSHNEQDQIHSTVATRMPLPPDGKVKRILDYGCGIGQLTVALKERFPDAEVWGLDIGGPMVRYGHMRASHMGVGVNFAQRLAEESGFPDGYFDMVVSQIAHHEMPANVTRQVITEVQRISRPGAIYYPIDFYSGGKTGIPRSMFHRWWDHRWNNEPWTLEYHAMDFSREIAIRGFSESKEPVTVLRGLGARHFTRV